MFLDVKFGESHQVLDVEFGEVYEITDGGYEKGYTDGYNKGYSNGEVDGRITGFNEGYTDGYVDGYNAGYTKGKQDGIAEGKQAEHAVFWNNFQNSGEEQNYYYAFASGRFSDANYNPKHDLVTTDGITAAQYMFYNANQIADTKMAIRVNSSRMNYAFYGCTTLHTIKKLIVHDGVSYTNTFQNCNALVNISIAGVIGQTISFNWSPLSVDSMKSIIRALKNYSGTASAYVNTVQFSDTCWEALDAEGATSPSGTPWRNYVTEIGWES